MKTYIYCIENCYNDPNKVYIGKTYIEGSRKPKHKNTFGDQINCITIDVIHSKDKNIWKTIETKWIQHYKDLGFNVQNKNEGGGGCVIASDEMKIKISKANKGKIRTEEQKKHYRKPKPEGFGEKLSKATKGHYSSKKGIKSGPNLKLKGRISPMKGKINLGIKGKVGHRTGKGTFKILDIKNNIIFNTKVECAKFNDFNINKMRKLVDESVYYKRIN
jgi:hypothetical protein